MRNRPADTRMMDIVHGALRRDLLRVRAAVAAEPHPRGRQRRALGEHAVWMMAFLHAHHTMEDRLLWPLIRQRDPAAAPLLDSLEAEHGMIVPAAEALTRAGQRYATTGADEARVGLIRALDALTAALLPHLDREVAEAMPVVSAAMTHAEWQAFERRHAMKSKRVSQLAIEAQWVLDGIDSVGYRVAVRAMPALARFVVLYGYRRAYRRLSEPRWRPDPAPEPVEADR
jgi:hypothetical protein